MEYCRVTKETIEKEHICCCMSDKKGEDGISLKKAWMKEQFDHGLVFLKLNERGKVFIEYIPAEEAWYPIQANGYMHINCFWVSGKYKGQGHANHLLDYCIQDAKEKGKLGVTIIASEKKRAYLPDAAYMKYKGFQIADHANPFFTLYYLPFSKEALKPSFCECAKQGGIEEKEMVLYYTVQCPFTQTYVSLIEQKAQASGLTLVLRQIKTKEQAQHAPSPFTTYSFYYKGAFVTNEIFSVAKFEKFLKEHVLLTEEKK